MLMSMKEINKLFLRLCKIVINIEDHVLQVAYISKLLAKNSIMTKG